MKLTKKAEDLYDLTEAEIARYRDKGVPDNVQIIVHAGGEPFDITDTVKYFLTPEGEAELRAAKEGGHT